MRSTILTLTLVYACLVAAYFVCFDVLELWGDYRVLALPAEIAIAVSVWVVVVALYLVKVRWSVISWLTRHCSDLNKNACPRLVLECHLPFCHCTGGVVKGWSISIKTKRETA